MASQIQARRDTATNWTSATPILAQGEFGLEIDTGKIKCGDGITAWNSLGYFLGANKVQLADAGELFIATDVEGALAEVKDEVARHGADEATLNQLGHIYHTTLTTTLDTTWTGTEAPYSKTQTVTGIVANDNPIIDVVMGGNFEVDKEQANEWSKIYRITTADNSITLYATDKPTVGLPIQLKVVR